MSAASSDDVVELTRGFARDPISPFDRSGQVEASGEDTNRGTDIQTLYARRGRDGGWYCGLGGIVQVASASDVVTVLAS